MIERCFFSSRIRIDIDGATGTLYDGEKFQLLFKFSDQYPFDSPQVTFIGSNIPLHPHIYSNGHICLSILTDDWSPALSINSVCLSILSMLSSCKDKVWWNVWYQLIDFCYSRVDHRIMIGMFVQPQTIRKRHVGGITMMLFNRIVLLIFSFFFLSLYIYLSNPC